MKIGDIVQTGTWLTGIETDREKCELAQTMHDHLAELAAAESFTLSVAGSYELPLDDDRAPAAPLGSASFLVCEALLDGHTLTDIRGSFVQELDAKDLERLIELQLRVYWMYNPGKPPPPRAKILAWIEENGPEIALETLREQVGSTIH